MTAGGLLLYQLANQCPIAWPATPKYPIDQGAPSSAAREGSHSPAKGDVTWLQKHYVDTLYGQAALDGINERIVMLCKALRRRRQTVVEALQEAVHALETFDRRYRQDVLKTLDSEGGPLQTEERLAFRDLIERECRLKMDLDGDEGDKKPKTRTPRELLGILEIVEVKLQIGILLELLARRQAGAELALDPDPLLRMYTDRLVIHQALSGLDLSFMGEKKGSDKTVELDDVQLFWRALEEVYADAIPTIFVDFIRGKLFTGGALSALDLSSSHHGAPSPMHQPTPDLKKLAQAVSDAAAENAANRVPESPTLAKFIANPSDAAPTFQPRPFVRSRSTINASFLSTRQKEMGVRPLAPPVAPTTSIASFRPHKRKAPEPARVPPESSAAASQLLVGTTPRRSMGRILAADTPMKDDADEDVRLPETPA